MYRKKLTYSFFTIPFAVVSFNVYDWQRRRAVEKKHEVDQRINRVTGEPVDIQSYYNSKNSNKFPWVGLNSRELNLQFGWRPIELNGQFDHSRQVLIEKVKDGEEGYDVVTPFYCYSDENGEICVYCDE
jgi:cytochrome oxidase assembly protein ShyY1